MPEDLHHRGEADARDGASVLPVTAPTPATAATPVPMIVRPVCLGTRMPSKVGEMIKLLEADGWYLVVSAVAGNRATRCLPVPNAAS